MASTEAGTTVETLLFLLRLVGFVQALDLGVELVGDYAFFLFLGWFFGSEADNCAELFRGLDKF